MEKRALKKLVLYSTVAALAVLPGNSTFAAPALESAAENMQRILPEKQPAEVSAEISKSYDTNGSDVEFYLKKLLVHAEVTNKKIDKKLNLILHKYEGKQANMALLNQAVADVTLCYRNNGYPAATAYLPAQKSIDGSIEINVELGRYGNIIIDNNSHLKDSVIKRLISGLHQGELVKGKKLETALNNIIDLGAVRAGGILQPGDKVGETNLVVKVEDGKRESYTVYSENYGSKSSGRYRYGVGANWYGLQGLGERLSINGSISNQHQHNYGLQYEQLVGNDGTKAGINFSKTDYELGSRYSALGAVGESTGIGLYGSTPLWKTATSRMAVNYGWDYRKLKDELRDFAYLVEKHSHVFHVGINGLERMPQTAFNYDFTIYAGHLTGDEACIGNIPLQISTEGTYTKAVFNTTLVQNLGNNFDILLKYQAQQAGNNLDSSEQFYLGGAYGVRAYPQGEGSGDEGYQATAELRYHTKVPGLTLSTYFDVGHVKYTKDSSMPGGTTLKGWGVGAAYSEPSGFWARFDYARRIGLADDATDDAKSKQRMWFMLGKTF